MKYIVIAFILILVFPSVLLAQDENENFELIEIEKNSNIGFDYPYYLYIPKSIYDNGANQREITILVAPNNTGTLNDSIEFHKQVAKKQILLWAKISNRLNTVVLMPVFPRPEKYPNIYTHALDRDVFLTDKKAFKRLDLQLIAMINDAKRKLNSRNIKSTEKVWITGFSASGMFANRFTFLHPQLIKAAAIGSPGGWPIAPVKSYMGKKLRYPIGVSDVKLISDKRFIIKELRSVPLYIYMGTEDDNDSVIYSDGYETEDKDLIFQLFGKSPIERWSLIENLYKEKDLNATFKLYPNIKHVINNEMIDDIVVFFKKSLK